MENVMMIVATGLAGSFGLVALLLTSTMAVACLASGKSFGQLLNSAWSYVKFDLVSAMIALASLLFLASMKACALLSF